MMTNFLKLNNSKTEFIVFGVKQQLDKVDNIEIKIGKDIIQNVPSVRNLGMHFDSELKHTVHVNKLTSTSYHTLHNISRVRNLLDKPTTQTLIQALVLSRLDYCNSLLLGIQKYNIQKIQRIQNMACRLINQLPRHSRVLEYMKNLHWLKIPERIEYKVLTIMYKCIHNSAPQYLQELVIQYRSHNRSLRSVTNSKLPTTLSRLT